MALTSVPKSKTVNISGAQMSQRGDRKGKDELSGLNTAVRGRKSSPRCFFTAWVPEFRNRRCHFPLN